MSGMGASLVTKQVDPSCNEAIRAYLERGGAITVHPANRHGTCERRKGIQFGNGNAARKPVEFVEQSARDLMADPTIAPPGLEKMGPNYKSHFRGER
jgi:hypothetical protein